MITKRQALEADMFHVPRPGKPCEQWRRNGKTQVWVTRPERFRVPVKWGLRTYGQLTERGLSVTGRVPVCSVHAEADCGRELARLRTLIRSLPDPDTGPDDSDRSDPIVFG